MTRLPDWSVEELEILLNHNDLSSEQFAELLPRRTSGAIEVVRAGVHSFHLGGNTSMLSEMMRQRLKEKNQPLTCPRCRAQI